MPGVAAALAVPGPGVDVATGIVVVASGAFVLARGRGPLLFVAGVAWLAGDVWEALLYAHRGPLVHLLLGRSPLTVVAYIDGLIPALARSPWPTLALVGAVVGATARRRRAAPLLAALAVGGAVAYEAVAKLTGLDSTALAAWWYDAAVAVVAVATAHGARPRAVGAIAADLVVELSAEPESLRPALARAIGDPTLEVAYRVDEAWVDESGRTVQLPTGEPSRVLRVVDDVAALVHDPAALRDGTLARSVDRVLRLTLANVRLQADITARVRDVERSRRRLVEAGAAERRRLREQLRTGAERHLEAAAVALARVSDGAALRAELDAAREELGRFAQGIHPRSLTERGLCGALGELCDRSPWSVRLEVPDRRFPPAQETVSYFVCAEALSNVAKYAPGADVQITVSFDAERLHVRIVDTGPGGADPSRGSGLRGLADRVQALGGELLVDSPPGGGTRLEAELPVAA